MTQEELAALVARYAKGQCTPAEEARLHAWYDAALGKTEDSLPEGLDAESFRMEVLAGIQAAARADDRPALVAPGRRIRQWVPVAAAAALLACLSVAYLFLFRPADAWQPIAAADVAPGTNKAVLTLADGRTINLDEAQTGIVVGTEDITYDDGISSVVMLSKNEASVSMLSLTTPKGGQYQVTLPDGSKVWLNSASTLKYPSRFSANHRIVEIDGEGYFEIEKDPKRPFKVRSEGQEVEVLGTAFNISAYADDPATKTTLVDGKVRVGLSPAGGGRDGSSDGRGRSLELKPGQQATIQNADITANTADIPSVIGWKEGFFRFSGNLESILQQVARWYAVEVRYADVSLKGQEIYGIVHRTSPLSDVLKMLEAASDAKFTVTTNGTERRVTVMR